MLVSLIERELKHLHSTNRINALPLTVFPYIGIRLAIIPQTTLHMIHHLTGYMPVDEPLTVACEVRNKGNGKLGVFGWVSGNSGAWLQWMDFEVNAVSWVDSNLNIRQGSAVTVPTDLTTADILGSYLRILEKIPSCRKKQEN